MNKLLFLMLFALAPIAMPAAEPLASFSSDGFEGWEYTRDATDVALNQNNILRKRITLFHDNDKGSDWYLWLTGQARKPVPPREDLAHL